jgi:hypothetical protein
MDGKDTIKACCWLGKWTRGRGGEHERSIQVCGPSPEVEYRPFDGEGGEGKTGVNMLAKRRKKLDHGLCPKVFLPNVMGCSAAVLTIRSLLVIQPVLLPIKTMI